jgi:hypothetical protein
MTGLYRANHRQIVRFRLSGCNDEGRGTGHSSDIAGVDRLDTTSVPRVSSVIAVANTSDYASSRIASIGAAVTANSTPARIQRRHASAAQAKANGSGGSTFIGWASARGLWLPSNVESRVDQPAVCLRIA